VHVESARRKLRQDDIQNAENVQVVVVQKNYLSRQGPLGKNRSRRSCLIVALTGPVSNVHRPIYRPESDKTRCDQAGHRQVPFWRPEEPWSPTDLMLHNDLATLDIPEVLEEPRIPVIAMLVSVIPNHVPTIVDHAHKRWAFGDAAAHDEKNRTDIEIIKSLQHFRRDFRVRAIIKR